ncbi:hypothetical protein [Agrobacterium sp. OT33]|uniref:hypothetical protein n=1 Tax=Agrobacterium sp. OT33 TaxID=2815338 RepID=UPI001A8E5993|nr:hypothetical protein [Agrobacterium sp. OT33]MBO0127130.1 hypothetical protein [Agrobacterium sp. OT33]
MNNRRKLTLAVGVGTIAIELALFAPLLFLFVEGLPLIEAFAQKMAQGGVGIGEKSMLFVSVLATLLLFLGVGHKASDYLRSRMCWALVRHFHGKG